MVGGPLCRRCPGSHANRPAVLRAVGHTRPSRIESVVSGPGSRRTGRRDGVRADGWLTSECGPAAAAVTRWPAAGTKTPPGRGERACLRRRPAPDSRRAAGSRHDQAGHPVRHAAVDESADVCRQSAHRRLVSPRDGSPAAEPIRSTGDAIAAVAMWAAVTVHTGWRPAPRPNPCFVMRLPIPRLGR